MMVAVAVMSLEWHYFTDTIAGAAVGVGITAGLGLLIDLPVVRRALGRLCQAWPGPAAAQDPPRLNSAGPPPSGRQSQS